MKNPKIGFLVKFTLVILPGFASGQDTLSGSRDPWLWPFSQNSIWNTPIGENAEYEPAGLEPAANVGVDIQHFLELDKNDPLRPVLGSTVWGPGRCEGTQSIGISFNVKDDWIVPDAGNSPYGLTPNSNFAFRLPESDMVFEGSMVSRCIEGGPVYMPDWMKYPDNRKYQDIMGDGLSGGGQGASGMSALGGTIRLGELVNDEPVRHALKINPWAEKYCYYSQSIPGYKWPAKSADNYASEGYKGTDPLIVMGTLFAIPPDVTEESLELTTIPGRKLFFTMQNYGVYFTEDAAWDTWDIILERDAEIEFKEKYGFSMSSSTWRIELNKLMKALQIVVNNSPSGIGGGGQALQPLAPFFESDYPSSVSAFNNKSDSVNTALFWIRDGNQLQFDHQVDVEIYNLNGSLCIKAVNATSINIAHLSQGIFILRVKSKGNYFFQKFLVQAV